MPPLTASSRLRDKRTAEHKFGITFCLFQKTSAMPPRIQARRVRTLRLHRQHRCSSLSNRLALLWPRRAERLFLALRLWHSTPQLASGAIQAPLCHPPTVRWRWGMLRKS